MTQMERPVVRPLPPPAREAAPAAQASTPASTRAAGAAGRPVTPIGEIQPRQRVAVAGVIAATTAMSISGCPACRYTLADETGEVDLLFLGRVTVAGFELGRRCAAAGAVAKRDGRLVIWNPKYQLLPADTPS